MGVKILSVGSSGAWNNSVLPPVTRGLAGWFDFDTEVRRGAFNRVIGAVPAGVVGTPQAAQNSIRVAPSTGYYQTGIRETIDLTLFTLMKFPVLESSMAVGSFAGDADAEQAPSYEGVNSFGASIFLHDSGTVTYAATRESETPGAVTSGGVSIAGATPATLWAIRVLRASDTQTAAFDKTAGMSRLSNPVDRARVPSVSPIRIGSATNSSVYPGAIDVSHISIYNAALSDDEIDQVVALIRKRALRLGLNV